MKKKFKIDNASLVIAICLFVVMFPAGSLAYKRIGSIST